MDSQSDGTAMISFGVNGVDLFDAASHATNSFGENALGPRPQASQRTACAESMCASLRDHVLGKIRPKEDIRRPENHKPSDAQSTEYWKQR